jgi:hypothetical protein
MYLHSKNYKILDLKTDIRFVKKMKKIRTSQSQKAGLLLPVARFRNKLKKLPQYVKRVTGGAGVYATAVLEYLIGKGSSDKA